MGGFTFTIGWGQKAGTSTERNGNPIEYTIAGNELYYIVIEGMSPVYSTPVYFLWNLNLIAYIKIPFSTTMLGLWQLFMIGIVILWCIALVLLINLKISLCQ